MNSNPSFFTLGPRPKGNVNRYYVEKCRSRRDFEDTLNTGVAGYKLHSWNGCIEHRGDRFIDVYTVVWENE
jgi:hypothetical protein